MLLVGFQPVGDVPVEDLLGGADPGILVLADVGERAVELLLVSGYSGIGKSSLISEIHRGIAQRSFEHRFQLADHVKVVGANLRNGLLDVELAREVPEAMKPRKIEIGAQARPRVIEGAAGSQAA